MRFTRQQRLLKTDEFSSVFNFRCSVRGDILQFQGRPNELPQGRLGLVVGKKLAKQAVRRNYMKRYLRELFRMHAGEFDGLDVIVWPRRAFAHADAEAVRLEFLRLMGKIGRCRAS